MKCPSCSLENPPSAEICDCGYNFSSGATSDSMARTQGLSTGMQVICFLIPIVGIVMYFVYQENKKFRAATYAIQSAGFGLAFGFLLGILSAALKIKGGL